jgi:hypothetical protein
VNAEGIALLRMLIFKMWSLNEAREHQNCEAMAVEINTWMPPGLKITSAHVDLALRGGARSDISVNTMLLRTKIDKLPVLYSARINCDYQAILNEVIKDHDLTAATLADVVEAMALARVPPPKLVVAGAAALVGKASLS